VAEIEVYLRRIERVLLVLSTSCWRVC